MGAPLLGLLLPGKLFKWRWEEKERGPGNKIEYLAEKIWALFYDASQQRWRTRRRCHYGMQKKGGHCYLHSNIR